MSEGDSIPRPPGPQPGALPTELRPPRGPESSSGARPCDHAAMSFSLGDRVPAFTLDDTEGAPHTVPGDDRPPATVLLVTCNHCPDVIAWNPRLRAVAEDYAPRGVRILAINANDAERYPADSPAAMARFGAIRPGPSPTGTTSRRRLREHSTRRSRRTSSSWTPTGCCATAACPMPIMGTRLRRARPRGRSTRCSTARSPPTPRRLRAGAR